MSRSTGQIRQRVADHWRRAAAERREAEKRMAWTFPWNTLTVADTDRRDEEDGQ